MKTIFNAGIFYFVAIISLIVAACNKDISSKTGVTSTTSTVSSSSSAVIAVAASTSSNDSVYVMQQCVRGGYRDSISASDLPGSITAYLAANYAGYTLNKAFAVKDSTGAIINYAAIIFYNNKPVGLLFTAAGSFVSVLEQRQPGDMHGPGWHKGGIFCNRDSLHGDSVALTSLPAVITAYMSAQYPNDTLLKAFSTADSGYVVISADNGLYATIFSSVGSFVKRAPLPQPPGKLQPVAQSALPVTITNYLTATYPDYVFDKAFSVFANVTLKGYMVLIDANNTKYAVAFDAAGTYLSATPVW